MHIRNRTLDFSPQINIGLSDTLGLWKCVILLLQNEDLVVRDAAAEVIQVAQSEKKSSEGTGKLTLLLNIIERLRDKRISHHKFLADCKVLHSSPINMYHKRQQQI